MQSSYWPVIGHQTHEESVKSLIFVIIELSKSVIGYQTHEESVKSLIFVIIELSKSVIGCQTHEELRFCRFFDNLNGWDHDSTNNFHSG